MDSYYSNCLIEAIKAKIKDRKNIQILRYAFPWGGGIKSAHVGWYDLKNNTYNDFHAISSVKGIKKLFYKGRIRTIDENTFKRIND